MKNLILVPTYNEKKNIELLLPSLALNTRDCEVLIIDDGSPDGTSAAAQALSTEALPVHVLQREKKSGLANAYQAGFRWALERPYEKILQMDADFSHSPKSVMPILNALDTYDGALGSRYCPEGTTLGWSKIRECISRGGNWYAKFLLGSHLKDLTGGFNGWRRKTLESITTTLLKSKGYAFQVELKYRALRQGFTLCEVPICFEERKFGESKMTGKIVFEAAFRVWQIRCQN